MSLLDRLKRYRYWIYGFIVLGLAGALAEGFGISFFRVLSGTLAAGSAACFVRLFTKKEQDVRAWFVFSYTFTLGAMALSILPFVYMISEPDDDHKKALWIIQGCSSNEEAPQSLKCPEVQWVINIGGTTRSHEDGGFEIRGGLVVPLYFGILALMGGAVSLTRRVPEYQRRYQPDYEGEDKLDRHKLRELLIFQMAQFVSAPLIAITAFYLVKPGNLATAVPVAFISGFSSETILLWIRAAATKMKPSVEDKGKKDPPPPAAPHTTVSAP